MTGHLELAEQEILVASLSLVASTVVGEIEMLNSCTELFKRFVRFNLVVVKFR